MSRPRFDARALALVGISKDQIRALEQAFSVIVNVTAVEEAVAVLDTTVSDIDASVTTLDTSLTALDATVATLPVRAVSASVPTVYTWISNDSGATWNTTSPQTQTAYFYDDEGTEIASQVISAARVDLTGEITASTGAQAGESVTVTLPADNGNTQVVSVVVVHNDSKAQTTLTWQSLTDTTALGGYGGGPSK